MAGHTMNYRECEGIKGGKLFTNGDGYYYSKNFKREGNYEHLTCKTKLCHGSAKKTCTEKGMELVVCNNHSSHCNPDFDFEKVIYLRKRILSRCSWETTPLREIFQEECAREEPGVDARLTYPQLLPTMKRARRKLILTLNCNKWSEEPSEHQDSDSLRVPVHCYDGGNGKENENEPKKNDGSEKSLDCHPAGEDDQSFEPAFVPVTIIKEEPEGSAEESMNAYSGELSLHSFTNEISLQSSDLAPDTFVQPSSPYAALPSIMCGNVSSEDKLCGKSLPKLTNYPTETLHREIDDSINVPHGDIHSSASTKTLNVQRVITGSEEDFTSMKNVVHKLEKITEQLACATDQYEEFGKYLASLLRGIPHRKFVTLKQKLVNDVLQATMALDEVKKSANATLVSSTPKPPEYLNLVHPNVRQVNPFHLSSSGYSSTTSFTGRNIPSSTGAVSAARDFVNSRVPTVLPVLQTSSVTSFAQFSLGDSKDKQINRSSSSASNSHLKRPKSTFDSRYVKKPHIELPQDHSKHMPLECSSIMKESSSQPVEDLLRATETRDTFEIEIEEGNELLDIKPDICDTSTSDYKSEITIGPGTSQEPPEALNGSGTAWLVAEDSSEHHTTTNLFCHKCNSNFNSRTDLKRHFMTSHPGEPLLFGKTCLREDQTGLTPDVLESSHSNASSCTSQRQDNDCEQKPTHELQDEEYKCSQTASS